jgi:hypothetical protein
VKSVEVKFNHGGLVDSEMLEEVVVVDDEFNDKVMLRVLDVVETDTVELDKVVAKVVVDVLVGVLQEQDPVRSIVTTVTVRVTVCHQLESSSRMGPFACFYIRSLRG